MANKVLSGVTVYLKKSIHSTAISTAQFGQCLANYFGFAEEGLGLVGLSCEENKFTLIGLSTRVELPSSGDVIPVILKHATQCPVYCMKEGTQLPDKLKERGVGLGVAILLTSSDGFVLVTRRSLHLRTFPGVWVPPGGHVEAGESLFGAGVRELREETGLELNNTASHHVLGLWESVYPHKLEFGDPVRQHVVVYLAVKSSSTANELSKQLRLDPAETDAAMWLPTSFVEKLSTGHSSVGIVPEHLTILQHTVDDNGDKGTQEVQIESEPILKAVAPPPDSTQMDIDRLSWGTRFALQQWTKWNSTNSKL